MSSMSHLQVWYSWAVVPTDSRRPASQIDSVNWCQEAQLPTEVDLMEQRQASPNTVRGEVIEIFRVAFDQHQNRVRLAVTVYRADRNRFIIKSEAPDWPGS